LKEPSSQKKVGSGVKRSQKSEYLGRFRGFRGVEANRGHNTLVSGGVELAARESCILASRVLFATLTTSNPSYTSTTKGTN
jgi:hypothetical protein